MEDDPLRAWRKVHSYGKRQESTNETTWVNTSVSYLFSVNYDGNWFFLREKHHRSNWTIFSFRIMDTHFCQNVCKEDQQTEARD